MANGNLTEEDLILQRFAGARKKLTGQQKKARQGLEEALQRRSAISGLKGGSQIKAQQKAQTALEEGLGEQTAALESAEAGALQEAKRVQEQREFAQKEREASQAFAAGESEKARAQQESQFARQLGFSEKQLDFQRNSFLSQLDFQFQELGENLKTNFINAGIAIKDAGLDDPEKFRRLGDTFRQFFGAPTFQAQPNRDFRSFFNA